MLCSGFRFVNSVANRAPYDPVLGAVPALQGRTVSLAAYEVPCVRFSYVVRRFTSFITATLGMGWWLAFAQRGLSPRKKRQAAPGALTSRVRIRRVSRDILHPMVGRSLDYVLQERD